MPLAPLSDAALVLPTVASFLGLGETERHAARDVLRLALHGQRLLLVLDNCEHLLAAAPEVAVLLEACPGLVVLATSREVLRLRAERVYPLAPLALPTPDPAPSAEDVARSPAARLFIERARAAAAELVLTDHNAATVAAICRRLDGLPLALELAAPRLKLLPPEALLARLDRALPLLVGGARDLPERQRTMAQAVAWSYGLLATDARMVFRRLSVFAGGCTFEAAEVVCAGTEAEPLDVLAGVSTLLDASLLARIGTTGVPVDPAGTVPRLGLLETIRDYGLEQLAASGEMPLLERRHALYYVAVAEAAGAALLGPEQGRWLALLEREHDNLRAALRWALEGDALAPSGTGAVGGGETATVAAGPASAGDTQEERCLLGLRLGAALWRFWHMRGHAREGRDWLNRLVALPVGEAPGARAARAATLTAAGLLAFVQADRKRAALLCAQGLALHEQPGDRRGMAGALFGMGRLEESVALYRQVGETPERVEPLIELALIAFQRGDDTSASQHYEESLALARACGDRRGIALALGGLGLLECFRRGNLTRAAALHEEALSLHRALGDTRGIAISLTNLGAVVALQGDYVRATALIEAGIPLRHDVGDAFGLADSLYTLAEVRRAQGHLGEAAALFEQSLRRFRELGNDGWLAEPLVGLADVEHRMGRYERARALLEELLMHTEAHGDRHGRAHALDGLGQIAAAHGQVGAARALHEQALALYRDLKAGTGIPAALNHLAIVARQEGDSGRRGRAAS